MLRISTPIDRFWASAALRATQDRRAGILAERVGPGLYRVKSSTRPGVVHTVTLTNVGALEGYCDCEHGASGRRGHCRHLANALMAEIARVSRKPAAPAPAPGPKPVSVEEFMARFARQ